MYDTFWNYIKKSFNLIFKKPILFAPTLISLLISIAFIIGLIATVGLSSITTFPNMGTILVIALGIIIMIIIELFISAGQKNMIKQAVTLEETSMDDFWSGAKKYAGRIFLGGIVIFVIVILALLILLVPAILIRSSGLTILFVIIFIIPAVVFGFLISFWETILIYEDCDVMEAFKLSFSFCKKHFGLVFVLNLLKGIFTGNNNSNKGMRNNSTNLPFSSKYRGFNFYIGRYFSSNLPLSMEAVGGIVLIGMLIKAFFTLYFDVVFFVVYHDRRKSVYYDGNGFDF